MDMMLLEPELLERAFHSLAPEDRAEIFSVGAAFHRLNLAKKTERAESKVCELEARYHTTLAQLEAEGLPEDADYRMHEDYIEWHYWIARAGAVPKGVKHPLRAPPSSGAA